MEYPKAFLKECAQILGSEFPLFERAMQGESERCMRLNPKRAYEPPFSEKVAWEENGRYVPQSHRPQSDIAHFAGADSMQDASAMAPVAALCPMPGEYVADLCAAPGGKSGQIAARLTEGFLLSNEYEMKRARMLSGNLERLGAANVLVTCADTAKIAKAFPRFFDAVLVDAPCSGEGMFRKDRDAVSEWTEESPEGCHARQKLLREAHHLFTAVRTMQPTALSFRSTQSKTVLFSAAVLQATAQNMYGSNTRESTKNFFIITLTA